MKITKSKLKEIIREMIEEEMNIPIWEQNLPEGWFQDLKAKAQKAYIKANPNSKYAKAVKSGEKEAPMTKKDKAIKAKKQKAKRDADWDKTRDSLFYGKDDDDSFSFADAIAKAKKVKKKK